MNKTRKQLRRPAAVLLCAVTVAASVPALTAGEVYADDSAVKTASGTLSSIPGEAEYKAAMKEYTAADDAFDEARDRYIKAKAELAKAQAAWESAKKDREGLDRFYDNAVAEAQKEETSAKKAADEAAKTLTAKQTAYDTAKKNAEDAASAYSTAVASSSDEAIKAQTDVVNSYSPSEEGGVIYAAHNAYVTAKNSASGNDRILEKIIVAKSVLDENKDLLGSVDVEYGSDDDKLIIDSTSQGMYITNGKSLAAGAWKNLYNAQQEYKKAKQADVDTSTTKSDYESSMTIDEYLSFCAKTVAGYESAVSEQQKKIDSYKADLVKVSGLYVRTSRTTNTEIKQAGLSVSDFDGPVASSEASSEFRATPQKLTADGNSAVAGTTVKRKVGKSSDKIAGSAPADSDSWYAVYNYENEKLEELVKDDSTLSDLLSRKNSTASDLADAKAELDSAAAADESAKEEYTSAAEKVSDLEAEQTKAKAISSDEMTALSENGTVPAGLTEVQELKTAYEKAKADVVSTRAAKMDAYEDYVVAKDTFEKIEKEFFKDGISKPKITVKRSRSGKTIKVSWKKVYKATKYRVRIKRSGGRYKTYYVKGTSKKFKHLNKKKIYYIRVNALNKYESSKSAYSGAIRRGKTIRK